MVQILSKTGLDRSMHKQEHDSKRLVGSYRGEGGKSNSKMLTMTRLCVYVCNN